MQNCADDIRFINVHATYQKLPSILNEVFILLRALTHGVPN